MMPTSFQIQHNLQVTHQCTLHAFLGLASFQQQLPCTFCLLGRNEAMKPLWANLKKKKKKSFDQAYFHMEINMLHELSERDF